MEQQKQIADKAKIITVIERNDTEQGYSVKLEIEGLMYYPYEVIINSLMYVTDYFLTKLKQVNNEDNLQLEESKTEGSSTGNGTLNNNTQPNVNSTADNGQV